MTRIWAATGLSGAKSWRGMAYGMLFAAALVGAPFAIRAALACDEHYDKCEEGQMCCTSCGCCVEEGSEAE